MKIKNINGTSQTKCICGSWLKHWKNFSKQTISTCPVTGCSEEELVGAHVQKAGSSDSSWYICPLCSAHNQSTGELDISNSITLVSANKKKTCE